MEVYIANVEGENRWVHVADGIRPTIPLNPRLDLWDFGSSGGFCWGCNCVGVAQLALALIAHATGNDDVACALAETYARTVLHWWHVEGFVLRKDVVKREAEEAYGKWLARQALDGLGAVRGEDAAHG